MRRHTKIKERQQNIMARPVGSARKPYCNWLEWARIWFWRRDTLLDELAQQCATQGGRAILGSVNV